MGTKRYPLVLMLEPLFLAAILPAPAAGKIDYPDAILNKRMTVAGMPSTPPTNAAPRWSRSPAANR